jgi:hypothetical protein
VIKSSDVGRLDARQFIDRWHRWMMPRPGHCPRYMIDRRTRFLCTRTATM